MLQLKDVALQPQETSNEISTRIRSVCIKLRTLSPPAVATTMVAAAAAGECAMRRKLSGACTLFGLCRHLPARRKRGIYRSAGRCQPWWLGLAVQILPVSHWTVYHSDFLVFSSSVAVSSKFNLMYLYRLPTITDTKLLTLGQKVEEIRGIRL